MISSPYFLVTKLDAFNGRGNNDFLASHDIEDIVAVLDGRLEVLEEIQIADGGIRTELAQRFEKLLQNRRFVDAVAGHMPPDSTSPVRISRIMNVVQAIAVIR